MALEHLKTTVYSKKMLAQQYTQLMAKCTTDPDDDAFATAHLKNVRHHFSLSLLPSLSALFLSYMKLGLWQSMEVATYD